ncbi:hypothetical protein F4556_004063 [Kitasatospora gansuensis]|uniref:Uncharacterized protein n=1 Tax=Kitasatospora gansuensis TaxID=258050 RepID=A0A7W7SDM6_9ACTN|nr:hypothetical protein [Kitasatospora gansuensis]MBB4948528.1 hypothetical protein [Kitasatospora gansuensis]
MTVRVGRLASGMSAEDHRLAAAIFMSPTGPVTTRGGCVPGGFVRDVALGDGMQMRILPGQAWVDGNSKSAQGGYTVTVDAPETVSFSPGHLSYDRIDSVVLQVFDDATDQLGQGTRGLVRVVEGVPAASPVAPISPFNSEKLYEVRVPSKASTTNTGIPFTTGAASDRRRYTSAFGGIIAEGWGSAFSGGYPGQYRDNKGRLERWDGAAWQPLPGTVGPSDAPGGYVGQYRDNGTRMERWSGSAWLPAAPATAFAYSADWGGTTSITYAETLTDTPGVALAATFTAPASGQVLVTVGSYAGNSLSTVASYVSANIRKGSTIVSAAMDEHAALTYKNAGQSSVVCTYQVTGLTAGAVHTATLAYRTGAATGTAGFDNRFVRVDPML